MDNDTWISYSNTCFIINRNHAKDVSWTCILNKSKTNESIFHIDIHAI